MASEKIEKTEPFEWQEKLKIKEVLKHGDYEAIEFALLELPNAARIFKHADLSIVKGSWFKAAIQSGWIVAPECKVMKEEGTDKKVYFYDGHDVDDMHPGKVLWLGKQILKKHDSVIYDDPKNW